MAKNEKPGFSAEQGENRAAAIKRYNALTKKHGLEKYAQDPSTMSAEELDAYSPNIAIRQKKLRGIANRAKNKVSKAKGGRVSGRGAGLVKGGVIKGYSRGGFV